MELVLTSVSDDLSEAWRRFCGGFAFVRVHEGSILTVDCDAVVSPANSFGFMDGGIDAFYLQHFGRDLQERVQGMIRERHGGELVVGVADVVETRHSKIPYLIVAPTMRVPMILRETVNPYLAARAALRLLTSGRFDDGAPINTRIRRLAMPGLGTGVGQVSANVCAHQLAQAIEEVVLRRGIFPRTWAEASERHQALYGGKPRRLQQSQD